MENNQDYNKDFKSWYGFSPYSYQFLPELANNAIPREIQDAAYNKWAKNKTRENMGELVNTFSKLINSEISRYQGTLERPTLNSYAKRYTIDAIKKYNPKSGNQLSTHLVHNLQRLHRLNYKNVQGLHTSEELQRNMNSFLTAKNNLQEQLGREPTAKEVAKEMNSTPKLVSKLEKDLKYEIPSSSIAFDPVHTETTDEDLVLDYVFNDLNDQQKFVFQHKIGYGGAPILQNKEIAKKLKVSPVRVTQISEELSNKFNSALGGATTK